MPRILAVDYGTKRLGFAVSSDDCEFAHPLRTVEVRGEESAVRETQRAAQETGAAMVVVGMPLNMNGSRGPAAHAVERFMSLLSRRTSLEVRPWDERLSTVLAERALLEADAGRRKRRDVRDKVAAQMILESFLATNFRRGGAGAGSRSDPEHLAHPSAD